ncbi:membrane-bound lytic murein transglycosylase D [Filimonas lacunae]|uniref:Membrane-bound lytic murein transglycosylase D n=1 Tax=Filimonas lacunae TaxID=477680 RepID=A0A173MCR1_9BACT|nr:lytic transglycosylase domain-containing protein [Filimonas lacunae]BAV05364.1 membrane-bound lytic murein transglycosylase D precursor [Filimonas lacunae]SIT21721.1 membrane-bound lytic murein transglycosylase D [Filimonas lacunae]
MTTLFSYSKQLLAATFFLVAAEKVCAATIDTTDRRIAWYKATVAGNAGTIRFVEYALQLHGIPKALRNLALIESDFIVSTLSSANAAGIWQITPDVAKDYGLKTSKVNDERYDVYKSTYMACRNLNDLYQLYKNWLIVIAAYNCGQGRVNKAMARAGSRKYSDFYRYLPDETILHVYKFMMACYATNEWLFCEQERIAASAGTTAPTHVQDRNPDIAVVTVSAGYKLKVIANGLQLPLEVLQLLNPSFEKELLQRGETQLQLPIDKMPDFLITQNQVLKTSLETE